MSTIAPQILGSKKNDSLIDWVRFCPRKETRMTQKDSGVSWSTFSGWTRWRALSSILLFRTPWWPLTWVTRMSHFVLRIWISFCVTFLPFTVPPVLYINCHTWLNTQNGVPGWSVHSCQWMTGIYHTQLPSCKEPLSDGWWLFQYCPHL